MLHSRGRPWSSHFYTSPARSRAMVRATALSYFPLASVCFATGGCGPYAVLMAFSWCCAGRVKPSGSGSTGVSLSLRKYLDGHLAFVQFLHPLLE